MSIYLLLGIPLVSTLILFLSRDEISISLLYPMVRGVVTWILGYLVFFFVSPLVELRYDTEGIYFFYFFRDYGYWSFVAIAGHVLLSLSKSRRLSSDGIGNLTAFMLGFFLLAPVVDLISYHKILNTYYLFLLPSLRIVLLLTFISVRTLFRKSTIAFRVLSYVIVLATAFLVALVPLSYTMQRFGFAYLACAIFFVSIAVLLSFVLNAEK